MRTRHGRGHAVPLDLRVSAGWQRWQGAGQARDAVVRTPAGHANQTVPIGDVRDLDVVHESVPVERIPEYVCHARFHVDEQVFPADVDRHVRDDLPLGRQHAGIDALSGTELLHVVGHHAVQEALPVRTGHAQLAAAGEVAHTGGGPDRAVFGGRVPVVQHGRPALEVAGDRAEIVVADGRFKHL